MRASFSLIISSIFLFSLSAQTVYEDSWFTITAEDNVCYADAFETDLFEFEEKEYFVYTGNEQKDKVSKYINNVTVVKLEEPKSKWTKINRVSDCLSADPMDCLRIRRRSDWYGLRYRNVKVVTDTTRIKEYSRQLLKTAKLVESRNGMKKVRVLCGESLTAGLQQSIVQALENKGYLASGFTHVQNKLVKQAIFEYQVHHGLPLGYLDYETLSSLDVAVED